MVAMNNLEIHISERITWTIESEEHLIHFLPSYSPDFNSIELTFSVLKAWIKHHYHFTRESHPSFDDFLQIAIENSHCDHFA